ncbi:ClpXP protease specificity-enhancing factor [Nitrosomonas sp.]|uniref:ClpXP protease specificity-enhancing factor n=1 Tax=Nitrosomonas sp. TaxID=42353 RepID=UPI00261FE816|nr:ClpXP protease specificity-enhancing factor [Nitrosomonas sp.]MCW5602763.1 ClpXP protease specificity-enhancing factor [Nitrosomonas sp.]
MRTTTKPYLLRAIYDWCNDNALTPYILVDVIESVVVPEDYIKNGEITLNISPAATQDLVIGNEVIQFTARFNGLSRKILIPINAVKAIFAKEINQGLYFSIETEQKASQTQAQESVDSPESGVAHDLSQDSRQNQVHLRLIK